MDISLKDKVEYFGNTCHFSLKVIGDYPIDTGDNSCFCGSIGCMRGVATLILDVPCIITEFLIREDIYL